MIEDRDRFGVKHSFLAAHRRRAADSFDGRLHKPCYACGSTKTDKWVRNPPTSLYLCRACDTNLYVQRPRSKTGKKVIRDSNNVRACYACNKITLSIFDPLCFGAWATNHDPYGYAIHYLCRSCDHNIIRYKRKYPMGSNYREGEKNANWRGGVNTIYNRVRNSDENVEWKKRVLERDRWTCQECGEQNHMLDVHHKKQLAFIIIEYDIKTFEEALACPELWDIDNGVTLCKICHSEKPQFRRHKK